ncbi:hypothetical protein J8I87_06175 [Paraburkholderia sp. LEh10]|uniref:hypothetical protein n=1 Tax=Paraburkholderia sp. LEh10 TaxID=2821353 RepID=UPI001AE38F21|nr:hypothetical protein [Paraburkholderia sp. LEh10]MBP0589311.1 hypothetical protein [Paraburkholderia sp. LEh10]
MKERPILFSGPMVQAPQTRLSSSKSGPLIAKKRASLANVVPDRPVRLTVLFGTTYMVVGCICRGIAGCKLDRLVQLVANPNQKAGGFNRRQLRDRNPVQGFENLHEPEPVARAVLSRLSLQRIAFGCFHLAYRQVCVSRKRRSHTNQPSGLRVLALLLTAPFKVMLEKHNSKCATDSNDRCGGLRNGQPICSMESHHA